MGSPVAELAAQLEQKVAAFLKEYRLPGVAAGIVHEGELAWSFGYGFADVEAERPADARTLYRIASITKTFTGTAIMQLRDQGKLRLDDPLTAYVTEFAAAKNPFGPIEDVTLRRLLSHEAGLQGDPPDADWGTRVYPETEHTLANLSRVRVAIPANTQSKYSNLGFRMLGEVVARVSGSPYVDYVRENILEPLEMKGTVYEVPAEMVGRKATGYDGRWWSDVLTPAAENPSAYAEGGLSSCVEDLAKWISFQFRTEAIERSGAQVLSGPSLIEMQTPRYLADAKWSQAFGLAFYSTRRGETVWTGHSGGLYGFTTNISFRTEDKLGAIVLLNGLGPAAVLAMDLGDIALPAIQAQVRPAEPPSPVPAGLGDYLGIYGIEDFGGTFLHIEWLEGELRAIDPDDPDTRMMLRTTGESDQLTVVGGREAGESAVFHRRADGRVRAVTLGPVTFTRFDRVDG